MLAGTCHEQRPPARQQWRVGLAEATLPLPGWGGGLWEVVRSGERYQVEVGEGHGKREGGGSLVARHEVVLRGADDVGTHAVLCRTTPHGSGGEHLQTGGSARLRTRWACACVRAAAGLACASLR